MDDLKSELAELKQFIVDLKADRAATKEKEKREAWTKYVSLSVVIVAVIASIAAQWAGKYSSTTQMCQAQASDLWNFYQAQSIKEHLFEFNRPSSDKNADFDAKIAAYEKKKAETKAKAEKLEQTRDFASKKGGQMGIVLSSFTVSIAIASICLVTKKKPLWFLSLLLAGFGVVQMILVKLH